MECPRYLPSSELHHNHALGKWARGRVGLLKGNQSEVNTTLFAPCVLTVPFLRVFPAILPRESLNLELGMDRGGGISRTIYYGCAESPRAGPPNSGSHTPSPVEVDYPLIDVEPFTNDRAADRYRLDVR